jgi:hypothetical protein
MNPEDFEKLAEAQAEAIKAYAEMEFPAEAGNTGLRFINENFRQQGWQGNSFEPWKPNSRNKTILVQAGHLRSGAYYTTAPGACTLRHALPYADIHNTGGTINVPVTDKMRKFAWAMYYQEAGKGIRKTKGGAEYQSITVGAKANKWRGLALTKKDKLEITIEKRQFFPTSDSPSPVLEGQVRKNIEEALNIIFNKRQMSLYFSLLRTLYLL